ncbi:MAG: phospho-N-acetylmuramoyl-pentapeptide-transferase [Oscillospiraceae bacterium]|jgi:phospho-N-acetylmuramoyl-pentapeptide-transferase|nr:phospho-N-acetylmuramoyl-pentapeptide-transferase [Oscillospiraceae bacterium]
MRYLQAFLISLVVTALLGRVLIPVLRRLKAGQSIKRDGPVWHMSKEGTPTMGGIMFIAGMLAAVLVTCIPDFRAGNFSALAMLAISLIYGAIGFFDDYMKVRHHHNEGLKAGQKFILQLAAAVAFVLLLRYLGFLSPNLYVPFVGVTIPLPEAVYVIFAAFVIVGTVNSVNLTDGVDGLVSGVTLPVAVCFFALAAAWKMESQAVFAAALTAGLLGFLIFNFHPAKVFMGDTGSLFLGGAVSALAFALDMPLVLIPLGLVYICETLSDILQVGYFKLTHGKRIFKMAPIHHHFEKCGWSEIKVFAVFSGVSLVLAVVTFFCVRSRYGL